MSLAVILPTGSVIQSWYLLNKVYLDFQTPLFVLLINLEMNKKLFLLFLVALVTLAIVVSIIIVFLRNKSNREPISLENQVSSLSIEFVDKKTLINKMRESKAIDGQKVDKIQLVISTSNLSNPTFIQKDQEGNTVIASSVEISDLGIAKIEISLGEYIIFEESDKNKSLWLDSEFFQVANQLAKWNLAARDELREYQKIEPFSVFQARSL